MKMISSTRTTSTSGVTLMLGLTLAQAKNLGTAKVNMQAGGKAWAAVGTFNFTAGWNKIAVSRWTTGNFVVIADAIRISN
jgi:hypothetical protein